MRRSVLASFVPLALAGGYKYVELNDPTALCLDGSRYGFAICQGNSTAKWEIGMQGGGWCYSEGSCLQRANTSLGSSATWPAETTGLNCAHDGTNYVQLFYGDGASFSGYREQPWPVPGTNQSLWFRGIRNIDATLDRLFQDYGLGQAQQVVITGGSAGGLATFLHVDHYAERIKAVAPSARVVARPLCGFFLDHGNDGYAPDNVTYPLQMQYVFNMQVDLAANLNVDTIRTAKLLVAAVSIAYNHLLLMCRAHVLSRIAERQRQPVQGLSGVLRPGRVEVYHGAVCRLVAQRSRLHAPSPPHVTLNRVIFPLCH